MKLNTKFLIFIFALSYFVQANEITDEQIRIAAEVGLERFLNKIPEGMEQKYGFKNRDEFSMAEIGKPIRMCIYTVDIVCTDEWRLPVIVNDEFRALLTVTKIKGKYRAVDFGASALANDLNYFLKANEFDVSSSIKIIRVYDIEKDFLLWDEKAVPIISNRGDSKKQELVVFDFNSLKKTIENLRKELNTNSGKVVR